jgi:hypothetical protein
MSEKGREEKKNGGVLMHLKVKDDEDIKNFGCHLKFWRQLAQDLGKTLVLEARLK